MSDVVWLLRHGNRIDFVDWSWRERAACPEDPPLSADGVEQVQRVAARLAKERIARIFSSPFLRAIETAHIVADVLDLPIEVEPGLGEELNPRWFEAPPRLQSVAGLRALFPRVADTHRPLQTCSFPETFEQAFARAGVTVRRLAELSEGPILCVGHGASVMGAAVALGGGDYPEYQCPLAALFKLERRQGQWHTVLRADTSHLEAG